MESHPFLEAEVKLSKFWNDVDVWLREYESLASRSQRRGDVKILCRFLSVGYGGPRAARAIVELTNLDLRRFALWSLEQPGIYGQTMMMKSVRCRLDRLKPFFEFLIGAGYTLQNPIDKALLKRYQSSGETRRPTAYVIPEKVRELCNAPDPETVEGIRDRALLAAFFAGATRQGELQKLRLSDIQTTPRGTVFLRLRWAKGKKTRDQALGLWAAKRVLRYLEIRRLEGAEPEEYFFRCYRFGGARGKRTLNASTIIRWFRKHATSVGIIDVGPAAPKAQIGTHSARATSITKLLLQGFDHRAVQEHSRHESIQMVEVYDKRATGTDESPSLELEFGIEE